MLKYKVDNDRINSFDCIDRRIKWEKYLNFIMTWILTR